MRLNSLIYDITHLKYLKSLFLGRMTTTEVYLATFLINHATTLRTLELANITLIGVHEDGQYIPSTWPGLLQSIGHSMSLDRIEFHGIMKATTDAGFFVFWYVHGTEVPCADDCLCCQIQRFVTRNGPWPSAPRDNSNAGWHFGLPSDADEDDLRLPELVLPITPDDVLQDGDASGSDSV
jgi:hypothetical protein